MAGTSTEEFIAELKYDARRSMELRDQMREWKTSALASIAEGNGGQIVSGSGNGTSFAASLGMTNFQWFTALGRILRELETGASKPTQTLARIV